MKFNTTASDSMPERKEVTERSERLKQEQAVRDRQLQEQQSSRPRSNPQ